MTISNQPCADPARLAIFENLTSYFLRPEPTTVGTCSRCGKTGIPVLKADKNGVGPCAAQAALTQKRDTVEDGYPLAFDSPVKKGRFSMTDKFVGMLVSAEQSVFTGKVAPTRPLPDTVEADMGLSFIDLLDRVMQNPPESFYLAMFSQKADMPLARSDADEFFINGTQSPVRIDRSRLLALVSLLEEFGYQAVASARDLKGHVSAGRERALRTWLEKNAPQLLTRLREAPHGHEPEFEFASRIYHNRKAHKSTVNS